MTDSPDDEMSEEELAARSRHLCHIGNGIATATKGMLELQYDCNCIHCQSVVLRDAWICLANEEADPDNIELEIRRWVAYLLDVRRELHRQVAYKEACAAAGVGEEVANEKPV